MQQGAGAITYHYENHGSEPSIAPSTAPQLILQQAPCVMEASNLWGQQRAAHPLLLQQQGQPTSQHQQAMLQQHHRQATQQQAQQQAMASMSMQHGQPVTWGSTMPQQCSTTQAANQATFPTVGVTRTQPTSAMDAATAQTIGMMHAAPQHSSAQYIFPNQPQPSFPTHTTHPFANFFTSQQAAQAPNMPPTSLTTLAQNMDPVARRHLIQLLASHEPTTTSIGGLGLAVATQQPTQQPQQPPSQHNQPPPPAQTHVSTATTDTTAVDAPRSEPTATPQSSTSPNSPSPRRKHDRSYRSRKQHRRSRTSHSESPAHRRRRQQRRRSSTSSRRPRKHQPVHRQRSRKHPTSPRRSRSRPGEGSPPALRVTLRGRKRTAFCTVHSYGQAAVTASTTRPHSASGHAASRQPPTPPPGRRALTPPQRTHDQLAGTG